MGIDHYRKAADMTTEKQLSPKEAIRDFSSVFFDNSFSRNNHATKAFEELNLTVHPGGDAVKGSDFSAALKANALKKVLLVRSIGLSGITNSSNLAKIRDTVKYYRPVYVDPDIWEVQTQEQIEDSYDRNYALDVTLVCIRSVMHIRLYQETDNGYAERYPHDIHIEVTLDFLDDVMLDDMKIISSLVQPPREQPEEEKCGYIHMISVSPSGYEVVYASSIDSPLIRDNYDIDVVHGFDKIVTEFRKPEPRARLAVLRGPPGTGKTSFIKGLVYEFGDDAKCIVIPPNLTGQLDSPEFTSSLLQQHQRLILIMEDADESIAERNHEKSKNNNLSTVLNLTDGLTGMALDICVIATTNRDLQEIDKAVNRPGRLLVDLNFNALDIKKAESILSRLLPREVDYRKASATLQTKQAWTLAEIYDMAIKTED